MSESRGEINLSQEAENFLETLVERTALKSGYLYSMAGSYQDYLENTMAQRQDQLEKKIKARGYKARLRPRRSSFAEEIKAYFRDALIRLIQEGNTEEAALRIMTGWVDQAELKPDFASFALIFDGFWTQEYSDWETLHAQEGELEGLFYILFLLLGITLGAFLGYMLDHTLRGAVIGLAFGFGFGLCCGLGAHIMLRMTRRKS